MGVQRRDWLLAQQTSSVAMARRLVEESLQHVSEAAAEVAVMLTSELVTNAVRHGAGPVRLRLAWDETGVRIEVQDHSPQRPVLRAVDSDAAHGRGLLIVDALSSDWGVETTETGKTVWCTLDHQPGAATR